MNERRMRFMFALTVVFGAMVIVATGLRAGFESTAVNLGDNGVALGGYDAVAYVRNGVARQGTAGNEIRHDGAVYQFASAENLEKFREARERFVPRYGGYCAFGVRMGRKLPVDPLAFDVVDGRLYVFLDQATKLKWQEDREMNIQIADKIWPELARVQ